jgi:hypothetical protein
MSQTHSAELIMTDRAMMMAARRRCNRTFTTAPVTQGF